MMNVSNQSKNFLTRPGVHHANIVQRVKTCYKIKINYRESKRCFYGKRIRDAAFFLIIMLVTFAATLLKPQNYVSSRTIQKCVE
ncbi:hypothetical protein, partial [Prevotella sp.]|uniref:hypothetical protein n=1 Tax=Prevotella sp. TaxID=59823 RepID=UPI003AF66722